VKSRKCDPGQSTPIASDDRVFLDKLGLELFDATLLRVLGPAVAGRAFEGALGLGEDLVHPEMDDTGLDLQFISQIGDGFLVGQMPTDDVVFLPCGEVTTGLGHGMVLLRGYR
jgi:hypothetical protein